jgi:hypothetical protein
MSTNEIDNECPFDGPYFDDIQAKVLPDRASFGHALARARDLSERLDRERSALRERWRAVDIAITSSLRGVPGFDSGTWSWRNGVVCWRNFPFGSLWSSPDLALECLLQVPGFISAACDACLSSIGCLVNVGRSLEPFEVD